MYLLLYDHQWQLDTPFLSVLSTAHSMINRCRINIGSNDDDLFLSKMHHPTIVILPITFIARKLCSSFDLQAYFGKICIVSFLHYRVDFKESCEIDLAMSLVVDIELAALTQLKLQWTFKCLFQRFKSTFQDSFLWFVDAFSTSTLLSLIGFLYHIPCSTHLKLV